MCKTRENENIVQVIITHADASRGCKAFSGVCVCLSISLCVCLLVSVCLCVCPHDKTKTAETTITKLATRIVHHKYSPTKVNVTRSQSAKNTLNAIE